MKILIISQYFWPEVFAITPLCKELVNQGHQVTVLTGKPNYPEGKIYSGYHSLGIVRENLDDVEVIRIPLRERRMGSGKNLLLNYLSFIINGIVLFPWLVRGRKFDVIFVYVPSPITSVIPAIVLKYIKKTHLVVWVQDLWPESLSATGFIKNRGVLNLVEYLVRGIYACTDTLLVQSQAFIKPVSALSNVRKIAYYPNVVADMQQISIINEKNSLLPRDLALYLKTHFCLVFAGNIGKAQSIETLIEVAKQLVDYPEIKIVFVGKGSRQEWAEEEVKKLKLDNVFFAGSFPNQLMPLIFSKAEVLLVTLKDKDIFSYTIPSKVQAYLSAGRPIIASINGEAAKIITEASAGVTGPAEDTGKLRENIIHLYKMNPEQRAVLGQNGRDYFLNNFEIEAQCRKLIEIFKEKLNKEK